jgi:hypothetical protein
MLETDLVLFLESEILPGTPHGIHEIGECIGADHGYALEVLHTSTPLL